MSRLGCPNKGPSPLARGSLLDHVVNQNFGGSIPARAGQPRRTCLNSPTNGVHPRSRGAAGYAMCPSRIRRGPSPLARGSLHIAAQNRTINGSIPARAGQPRTSEQSTGIRWVHPRSRGAAPSGQPRSTSRWGPSPLARGSPNPPPVPAAGSGSIPARAGQPLQGADVGCHVKVHPRSRGAANVVLQDSSMYQGPSPLARGSLRELLTAAHAQGSIPARAGQPRAGVRNLYLLGVHPRSRGAAK